MAEPAGIIYPPPELKVIVDKTAGYVAKNGPEFEDNVKRKNRDNPKLSFLFPEDPFNAYYQHKVRESRNSLLAKVETTASTINNRQEPSQDRNGAPLQASNERPKPSIDSNDLEDEEPSRKRLREGLANDNDDNNNEDDDNHDDDRAASRDQPAVQSDQAKSDEAQQVHRNQHHDNVDNEAPRTKQTLDDYIRVMTTKLEEPPPLNFLADPGQSITQMGSDVLKITSQYIATYGRSFLLELVSREQNNIMFDFLKPQHGQFSYMLNLIMQYALIRNPPLDVTEQLGKDATSQKHVLDKIKMRAEWNRVLEIDRRRQEEELEKEKLLYYQIDWHDFVIVETIDYQPDEEGEYPPTTADQVGTRLLIQQRFEEQSAPEEMDIDDMDDSD